jgi:hypothetical protein
MDSLRAANHDLSVIERSDVSAPGTGRAAAVRRPAPRLHPALERRPYTVCLYLSMDPRPAGGDGR